MPARNDLADVIRRWVIKAENDFRVADLLSRLGRDELTDAVCFHAQQSVEKYLKARLVFADVHFRKVHDIRKLVELLPNAARPPISASEQGLLSSYAVELRYPGEAETEVTVAEAGEAVRIARRVRAAIRRRLPRASVAP